MAVLVVLDTNVLVAALRSRSGASFRVLSLVGTGRFEIAVSVPIVFEYESALLRRAVTPHIRQRELAAVVDYLCSVGRHVDATYLWRPALPDADDDHVLELAVAGGCNAIVTFNARDFVPAASYGIGVWSPADLLRRIGDIP